jgi:hypothetical protein
MRDRTISSLSISFLSLTKVAIAHSQNRFLVCGCGRWLTALLAQGRVHSLHDVTARMCDDDVTKCTAPFCFSLRSLTRHSLCIYSLHPSISSNSQATSDQRANSQANGNKQLMRSPRRHTSCLLFIAPSHIACCLSISVPRSASIIVLPSVYLFDSFPRRRVSCLLVFD